MTQRPDGARSISDILLAARARLARLTPEERSLFHQHEVEGLSWEEIARRQGDSPDALRIRLTRALARVRKQLTPEA